jgi:hypothetical protein
MPEHSSRHTAGPRGNSSEQVAIKEIRNEKESHYLPTA